MSLRLGSILLVFLLLAAGAGWVGRETAMVLDHRMRDAKSDLEMRIGLQRVLFRGDPVTDPSPGQLADEAAPWLQPGRGSLDGMAVGRTAIEPAFRPTFEGWLERLESADNPALTVFSHFDVAFVVLVFWPWMILFSPTPAPWTRLALWGAGPVGSLVAAAVAGLAWGSAESWIRLSLWLLVVAIYGWVWLRLRDVVESRSGDAWRVKAAVYVGLVFLLPAAASLVANTVARPGSRLEWAGARYEAGREPAWGQSLVLAPYYEKFPEFAAPEIRSEYDVSRWKAAKAWRAALDPVDARQEASMATHRLIARALRLLSPVSLAQGALIEIAGTGEVRSAEFQEAAVKFARDTWAPFFQKLKARQVPAEILNKLPRFEYTPALMSGLLLALIYAAVLAAWPMFAAIVRKR